MEYLLVFSLLTDFESSSENLKALTMIFDN